MVDMRIVRSGSPTSAWVRWSLNHLILVSKNVISKILHWFLKQFQFCMRERKYLILVWWGRNHLILVRSGSPTSAWVRWSLNHSILVSKNVMTKILHWFLKQFQFCIRWRKYLISVYWSRNHLMKVLSASPTSAWVRWSLNHLILVSKNVMTEILHWSLKQFQFCIR